MARAPKEESVDQLFQIVERLMADERARGQGLETKTSTLAGFTGTILALTAGLGHDLLVLDLGRVGDPVFVACFLIAVLALAAGAVLAVLGVLRPQEHMAIGRSEIKRFAEYPLIATPPIEIQGRMIRTLVTAFDTERRVNDRKARLTHYAAVALVVGLVGVAGEAVTVAVASSG